MKTLKMYMTVYLVCDKYGFTVKAFFTREQAEQCVADADVYLYIREKEVE